MTTIRAVAYPRYSSDNQREESIDAQMRAIEAYCLKKGYVLVGSYPDEAQSAKTDDRPNFQRMISDSAKGLFDVVIVHKLNRFARNRYDSAIYKRRLKKNGVRVESVTQQLDDSPESIILESVLEGMDEYYSLDLARETRKGLLENAMDGKHTGGRPPYGYKVNSDTLKLEIDEKTAPAVRLYFESIADGIPAVKIADTLNNLGYRTYTGRKFTKNSFWDWSKNKKYMGVYTWDVATPREDGKRNFHNKKPVEDQIQIPGAIPAIVSPELWEKVNTIMQQRQHKSGHAKAKQVYLLAGKIYCGKCDSLYRGESYPSRTDKDTILKYYKCGGRSSTGRCKNTSVRKDDIEEHVTKHLINTLFTDEAMERLVKKVKALYETERANSLQDVQPIKRELREIQTKIDNWIDAIGTGLLDKFVLANKIREANNRKALLESELARINIMNEQSAIDEDLIRTTLQQRKNTLFSSDEEEKKHVIQELVDRVVILPSNSIDEFEAEVTYRFLTGVEDGT